MTLHAPYRPGMDRRRFVISALASTVAAPRAAEAQPAGKVPRIGVLSLSSPQESGPHDGFQRGLRKLGYVEGQNIAIERLWASGSPERLADLAHELARLKVDVIVAPNDAAVAAAQKATRTIPIVMVLVSDPVRLGFVASLARPGGNITGVATQAPELVHKRLQLLKEAVPKTRRLAVIWNPTEPGRRQIVSELEAAARLVRFQMRLFEARGPGELDSAFTAAVREGVDAIYFGGGALESAHRARMAQVALKSRLPTLCTASHYTEAGCLMSYAVHFEDQYRRAATYVDKILKGAKPADLPVEQPTRFELVINLKTAKALGLTIPPSLLARADQVIE